MGNLLFFLFLAIFISFLCSVLEAVLLSTNMSFISSLEQKNKKGSRLLKKLKTKINTPIAAILTVNTIAHTIGAAGVGAQSAKIFGQEYMFLISGILTLLILYFSEIIPKTIGAIYWKKLAVVSAYLINILIYLTYPLTILAEYTTRIFANKEKNPVTREELLANALLSEDAGEINESESDIIENTLGLSKSKVKDILTPRAVVFALNKGITVAQAIEYLNDLKTFSRIPLYDESIDKITAKVLSKEILLNYIENSEMTLESFAKPIYSIHENIPVSKTLSLMLQRNEHLFVVNDSFGQTSGVVSMEDCLETLLGKEIVDESDQVEDLQELAKKLLKKK